MKLSLHQGPSHKLISSIRYPDNVVSGAVSFWANVKYQSPQFPLDLYPRLPDQLNTLYKGTRIPVIDTTTFKVTSDDDDNNLRIEILRIVQLKICYIGTPESIPTRKTWEDWFDINERHWNIVPDGSAYVTPMDDSLNTVSIKAKEHTGSNTSSEYFSYNVLVAFQVISKEGIVSKTFYANFDPFVKVTNQARV